MQALSARFGGIQLRQRPPFVVLSRSVIAQQISTKAANTIRSRVELEFGWDPFLVATAPEKLLRSLGLSQTKATCLRHVAQLAADGHLADLQNLPDREVTARLMNIRGIGPWTVNMFLIFCLARQDIWPVSDAGLRAAALKLYDMETSFSLQGLGDRFRPFRSIAAIYLWKSLENDLK